MLAASTASAFPNVNPSCKSSRDPAPPLAITGTSTEVEISLFKSKSYPLLVPSISILVSNNSPDPIFTTFFAHFTASIPVETLPP